jgi:tellurite resistance protein
MSAFSFPYFWQQSVSPMTNWGSITVNYQGNPEIESAVVQEIAGYGKQLGILTEAVLALADRIGTADGNGGAAEPEAVERLRRLAAKIEDMKERNRFNRVDDLKDQLKSLARRDPATAQRLIRRLGEDATAAAADPDQV